VKRLMKIKFISKITASVACAVIIFCMASMSISGNPVLSIRAGEGNIITNESMDKQMDIKLGDSIIDSVPVGICLRWDANSDGTTDVFDAISVAKYTVNTLKMPGFKGSLGEFAGNVNEDDALDVFDAVAIAKFTVCGESDPDKGWEKVLGRK